MKDFAKRIMLKHVADLTDQALLCDAKTEVYVHVTDHGKIKMTRVNINDALDYCGPPPQVILSGCKNQADVIREIERHFDF